MTAETPAISRAVAVYCGSSFGNQEAFSKAARSLGNALAEANRPLVYGGGSMGIMGVISDAVLEGGGKVTGIVPYAIFASGGEKEKAGASTSGGVNSMEREKVDTIVVDSMHDRKVEMAKRVKGFVGLPGGFGTFEEILEVTTWTQLGIHNKPVVILNVLSFFDPLRQLIQNGIAHGYISPSNERIIVFVDGPESHDEHENYDWGKAALEALDEWRGDDLKPLFDWSKRLDGTNVSKDGKWGAT